MIYLQHDHPSCLFMYVCLCVCVCSVGVSVGVKKVNCYFQCSDDGVISGALASVSAPAAYMKYSGDGRVNWQYLGGCEDLGVVSWCCVLSSFVFVRWCVCRQGCGEEGGPAEVSRQRHLVSATTCQRWLRGAGQYREATHTHTHTHNHTFSRKSQSTLSWSLLLYSALPQKPHGTKVDIVSVESAKTGHV